MRMTCPHCQSTARIRTSRKMSELTRELSVQCENVDCCHTWVAIVSAVRTICPSINPNSKVFIPRGGRLKPPDDNQGELQLNSS